MKTLSSTILILTIVSLVVSSCKKKDEAPAAKTNFFTVDGKDYAISKGVTIEYGGSATTGYNFDLLLASSGFDFSDFDNSGVKGSGELIYFELWSTSTTGLETGSYSISSTAQPNTYTSNEIDINYDSNTGNTDKEYEATAGTVTIKVEGTTYTIDIDLTVAGGTLTGNYTGTLTNYKN